MSCSFYNTKVYILYNKFNFVYCSVCYSSFIFNSKFQCWCCRIHCCYCNIWMVISSIISISNLWIYCIVCNRCNFVINSNSCFIIVNCICISCIYIWFIPVHIILVSIWVIYCSFIILYCICLITPSICYYILSWNISCNFIVSIFICCFYNICNCIIYFM